MTLCENCIHKNVCGDPDDRALTFCSDYTDKAEWFHLPAKDVKSAYFSVGYGDAAKMIEEDVCGFGIKDGKLCVVDNYGDFYELGRMVFLTKEEAQKDVERRRKLK